MQTTWFMSVIMGIYLAVSVTAHAATLDRDAETAIPRSVQQLLVLDNRVMQQSPTARSLKSQVLTPELKRLELSLQACGVNVDRDIDLLAFAVFTAENGTGARTVAIAKGKFQPSASFIKIRKRSTKALLVRNYTVSVLSDNSAVVFLDQTTIVFGDVDAVKESLDAHDGIAANMLANTEFVSAMPAVVPYTVWSLLDQRGTQEMMRDVLGDAVQLINFEVAKSRLRSSRYVLDFQRGVRFELMVATSDTFTGATLSAALKGAALMGKSVGDSAERVALDDTTISSNSGLLSITYRASEGQFATLVNSKLFRQVTR